ncbi:MAG: hypothetical protein OXI88_13210 [Gammaproteobacteria bacterium]|nr:hypothetical protein [Gammaproteobacteria bacterium]MDE0285950.1 hypothetical protein [Gammaproteobacteria bacterium]MDE0512735.1 hypothetical protein [Gammaproteobacteria bacterium]
MSEYQYYEFLAVDQPLLAEEDNTLDAYSERLNALRTRHSLKARFIERLTGLE